MKLLSATLSALILLVSPGLGPISAFAQVVEAPLVAPAALPAPALSVAPAGASLSPLTPALTLPALAPSLPAALPTARAAQAAAPALALPAAAPVRTAVARAAALLRTPAAPAAAAPEKGTRGAFQALAAGVQQVGRAAPAARGAVLDRFFTGSALSGAAVNAVAEGVPGAESAGRSGLAPAPSAADLDAAAVDSKRPLAERKAAVQSLAKAGGDAAKAALERVAAANPAGGAEDYEVHRESLRALAVTFGELRSLRPVSAAHAEAILKRLKDAKPTQAVFDYDDTLEPFRAPASAETGAALKAAADAGVSVAILTDRPAETDGGAGPTILDSLAGLPAAEKAAVTVAARAGGEMVQYDGKGRAALLSSAAAWTAAQRAAIDAASQELAARFGSAEHQGKTGAVTDYSFYRLLPVGTPQATMDAAVAFLRDALARRGLTGLHIVGRYAKSADDPPYVQASMLSKRVGIGVLRGQRSAYERLEDLRNLGLPPSAAPRALSWLRRIPEPNVPAARMLVVGDQFFGSRNTDAEMADAAPGALVIAVGGKADPRLDNVFVWPKTGHAGSQELLGALAKPADSGGFQKKAVVGLFIARSLSIASFILTAIAYPFVAAPAVGWAAYGALMGLGPLAAIATGPLNGALADRFSARTAHVFNMVVRAVLAMALPAFWYFGVLNFWTLLIASIGNGWALSTIMTSENAWVRRLAGRHQNAVQAGLSVNFVALQVILGLLFGVGAVVDKINPISVFVFAAVLHAFVITPIYWFTMPKLDPQGGAAAKPAVAKKPFGARVAAFARRYWKEALITAASGGVYALTHSTLPLAAALCWWVFQTDTAKALRRGDYREVNPREREIAARLAEKAGADDAETLALSAEARTWKRRQFMTIVQSAGQAVMTYPFQNFALPLIATLLVGAAGKGLLLGKLLGAMYFGTLIANSSQINLPELRLPILGRIPGQRLVQGLVVALAGAWVYTGLLPGSLLAALAAMAGAVGLLSFASRVTSRGWIRMLGVGLAALALPAAVWFFPHLLPFLSVQNALFIAMLFYGLFTGPSAVSLNIYQQNNTDKKDLGKVMGTGSSFFNTFNSLGYGLLTLAAGLFTPAFPMMFLPLGALYALGGLFFWTAPRRLPGLPPASFKSPSKPD